MMQWFHHLAQWMIGLAETSAGPWSLFGLAAAEACFFPIPPDLLLLALDLVSPDRAFLFAGICTAGSVLGGAVGYAIGRWGGRPVLSRLVAAETIQGIQQQFQRYDAWAILIAGFTPIPYKVFTVAAGVFYLDFWRFMLASLCARGGRFFLVSTIVFIYREQARRVFEDYFEMFTIGFVVLLVGGFLFLRWLGPRMGRRADSPTK